MLAQRLDKLETDLQLLITMHDMFLEDSEDVHPGGEGGGGGSLHNHLHCRDDVPERDTSCATGKLNGKKHTSGQGGGGGGGGGGNGKEPGGNCGEEKLPKSLPPEVVEEPRVEKREEVAAVQELLEKERNSRSDLEREIAALREELDKERDHRREVEESAKQIYIQLQKVQEDLRREREMKEGLLMESLQLKTKAEEWQDTVGRLRSEAVEAKVQVQQLEGKCQTLAKEKANLVQRLVYLCQDVGVSHHHNLRCGGTGGGFLQKAPPSPPGDEEAYFEFLKSSFQQLKKLVNREDGSGEQIRKLTSQLNTLVGRCATLEKERDGLKVNLSQCQDREDHLKNQLHMCQIAATSGESELLKKQIEHECILQKITSTLQTERERFSRKMDDYSGLIRKSKELLVSLRDERDQSRRDLHRNSEVNREVERERQRLTVEVEQLKTRLGEVKEEKRECLEWSRTEKGNLEGMVRRYKEERRKLLEVAGQMKEKLVGLQGEAGLWGMERERLIGENKRLDDNLRVIRKVSEDQGKTVGKLRGEVEGLKEERFKMDEVLREFEGREKEMLRRLEEAEVMEERYLRKVRELEEKIAGYSEELRGHDCQDFVDSRYKRRVEELEETLEKCKKSWEGILGGIRREKEDALEECRNLQKSVEEIRRRSAEQLKEIKERFQAEVGRLGEGWRRREEERVAKIGELHQELDRLTASSSQVQRALSQKIKQLQAALSICLGQDREGIPNPSHHHPHPPHHSSGGGGGGLGFNNHNLLNCRCGCCDAGGPGPGLNLNRNQNHHQPSHTCHSAAPPASTFRPSGVGTSADFCGARGAGGNNNNGHNNNQPCCTMMTGAGAAADFGAVVDLDLELLGSLIL